MKYDKKIKETFNKFETKTITIIGMLLISMSLFWTFFTLIKLQVPPDFNLFCSWLLAIIPTCLFFIGLNLILQTKKETK